MNSIQRARGIAASCWADPRTRGITMDPVLAEVVAERLAALVGAAEALYMAGRWVLEDERIRTTDQEQAKLWEDLRDALGLKPGQSEASEAGSRWRANRPCSVGETSDG